MRRPSITVSRVRIPLPEQPLLSAVDRAVRMHEGVVPNYVAALRRRRPDDDPGQVIDALTAQYLAAVTGAGAAVGGAAAVPAVGTMAAVALGAGEIVAFLEATAMYTLAVAQVHGVQIEDVERRRTLLLAVLAGEGGAELLGALAAGKVGGRQARVDAGWAKLLPDRVPRTAVEQANRMLGRWLVRRFGAKQGAAALGRLVPFGVGALVGGAANAALGRGVVSAVRQAFGPAPREFAGPAVVRRTVRGTVLDDGSASRPWRVPQTDV